jgi:WD40 repeat protein
MVYLWDTTSAERITTIQAGSALIRTLSFSPDGKFLLTGSSPDGLWIIWGVQA